MQIDWISTGDILKHDEHAHHLVSRGGWGDVLEGCNSPLLSCMNYTGVIIEESLESPEVLKEVMIISTKVEIVTKGHQTPWLADWTLHTVEIPANKAESVAQRLSEDLDSKHPWYADYKNDKYHYIIYRGKIFKVDLKKPVLYKEAKQYGIALGIPEYQVDFSPDDKLWER